MVCMILSRTLVSCRRNMSVTNLRNLAIYLPCFPQRLPNLWFRIRSMWKIQNRFGRISLLKIADSIKACSIGMFEVALSTTTHYQYTSFVGIIDRFCMAARTVHVKPQRALAIREEFRENHSGVSAFLVHEHLQLFLRPRTIQNEDCVRTSQ